MRTQASASNAKKPLVALLITVVTLFSSTTVVAQQSLFNVPSVESTQKGKLFFQEQLDLFSNGIANTTLDYGLDQLWEVGITVPGVSIYNPASQGSNPMLLLNVQKGIELKDYWKMGIGTQTGYSLPQRNGGAKIATYNYMNNAFDLGSLGKYYLGAYEANKAITGENTTVHMLAGLEVPMTESLHLMADYTGGNNDIGAKVLGLVWYASKAWQFSLGGQFNNDTKTHHAFQGDIVEITFIEQ